LLEARAELHDVRDFLGHASITTTSRYLRSTSLRLERALSLPERREFRTGATPVPHDAPAGRSAPADESAELDNLLEVDLVSRIFASWNQLNEWLRQIERLRRAA